MHIIINKKKINELLINIFVFLSVVFPADIFGLKKIFFLVIIIFNFNIIIKECFKKKNNTLLIFGIVFPSALVLYSIILTGNILNSFNRSFSAFMFIIIFVIQFYNINYSKILEKYLWIVVVLTISIVALDIMSLIDVNNGFTNRVMYDMELGLMGKSITYSFYYKVFFKASPLMIILLYKTFDNNHYLKSFFILLALVLSGTRANVLFPLTLLVLFYILHKKTNRIKLVTLMSLLGLVMVYSNKLINMFYQTIFVKGALSDSVRYGHIEGIKQLLMNKPWSILTGTGMGSTFYSYGRNKYIDSMELSYIDLWRQMGVVFFVIFLIFLLYPLFKKNNQNIQIKFAYVSYLLVAATNPLLFSSTAYLLYIYIYNLGIRPIKTELYPNRILRRDTFETS